ncbi:DUF2569 family protein [Mucilaginibacter robiniae]|uniref:DUF2569 family protein n=1 Tax=Mucilaginibacter robiniae TaxID=2728022 RepID=A0A7L5E2R3_9SPHI|nr:DUF3857 domain-containing protein [Mucilaginibacter robiniae]QJD95924.1 DUF2569 family protein [Mucilaginibacter robiniae]
MQTKPFFLSLIFLVLLQVSFCCSNITAAEPIVHVSPKPAWLTTYKDYQQKIPLRDVGNGYFFQLIEEQIQIEKQADYRHSIREIVSEAGIQNGSEISINFDPTYERLDFHEITVWRNNKPENRLNAGAFKIIANEKELSKFIYQGSYSAYCILDDIRKGDRIEYSYTITGRNPIFNNKFAKEIYFQSTQPIAHQYKCIIASSNRKLNFKSFNLVPKAIVSDINGLKTYTWESFQVSAAQDYDNEPGWYNPFGYIQISDYSSWKEVTDWALKINPISKTFNKKLALQIAELKVKSGNDKEKYFRNAVRMVQDEVRYMGIEMGQYSHLANTPDKVYSQRYGDCKDKSLLLASILNAGGINSQIVLVNSSIKSKIDEFIPSPNAFDHVIVVATVNNKQVWADATMAYQRGTGTNLYFPNYGKGLIVKDGNSNLTTIPLTKTGKVICKERYTVPNEKAKVTLEVRTTYTLNEADKIRDKLASSSMAETEKNYLDYYVKIYPKIESKDSITVIDDEEKNQLTTIEHYLITDFFKQDTTTGKYTVSFYANYINAQLPSIPNNAKTPIALNYPCDIDYTISVVLPYGWNVDPSHYSIKKDAYALETFSRAESDTLSLSYNYNAFKDFIPVNQLAEYRSDIKHITDDELSYTFDFNPNTSELPFRLNYWMLITVIAVVATAIFIAVRVYRTETEGIVFAPGAGFMPIGGWLIWVAISLALTPLSISVSLITNDYFNLNKWNLHELTKEDFSYKALFIFEILGNVLLICYATFCFILLLKRRDILPKLIIGLYIFAVVFFIIDCSMAIEVNGTNSDQAVSTIFRSAIVAAIWIPYFKKSVRVEQTFIVPYPANNYRYEEKASMKIEQNI